MKFLFLQQTFRTLRYRNYRLFFIGQSISLIGTWMQQIALSWLVYDLTHSAYWLGIVGFVGQAPTFFITPFAGVVADRYNRHRALIVTQSLAMLQAAILATLVLSGRIQLWHIVVLSIFSGIINACDIPIRQAFTIEMIENKKDLSNAIALNSSMVNMARLVGPSIAGILIAFVGEGICFLINAASYVAVIVSLLSMKLKWEKKEHPPLDIAAGLKEGFKYAFELLPIRYILLLVSMVSFFGVPFQVLMPIFARDVFHGGAKTLGFLMGMAGGGALTGAIYLASRKSVVGLGKVIVWVTCLFGGGLIGFALCPVLGWALIIIYVAGLGMMVQMASSNIILQTIVDEDKRGRVMSFYTMAFMGSVPFGNLFAGLTATKIGAANTLLIGGSLCIIGAVIFARQLPVIRQYIRPIYIRKGIISPPVDIVQ